MREHRSLLGRLIGCLLGLAICSLSAIAQTTDPGEWTWEGGHSKAGVYVGWGSFQTFEAGNGPGDLVGASGWTDANGDLWLFGGLGNGFQVDQYGNLYGDVQSGFLDNLWEFDPAIGEWALMRGTDGCATLASGTVCGGIVTCLNHLCGQPGAYGGTIPVQDSVPAGRLWASHWTDDKGKFWLFGGNCFWTAQGTFAPYSVLGLCGDLWEYDPSQEEPGTSRRQWALKGGVVAGTTKFSIEYGSLGIAAPSNFPGPRQKAANWTDADGNLWLFGGSGLDAKEEGGYLNDLWQFDPSTNEWTWMGGSSTVPKMNEGRPGVYGTLRIAASGNIPGGRIETVSWADGSGDLWLFGGYGFDAKGNVGQLNDLWKFNPSRNEWTWMGGSDTVSEQGTYGALGMPSAYSVPGAREAATGWVESSGNLWLFGGFGLDSKGQLGDLNDEWEYSPSLNQWAWVGGSTMSNQQGADGMLGTPASGNIPPSRDSATSWTDGDGNLWLFGGHSEVDGTFDDLWKKQTSANGKTATDTPVFSIAAGKYSAVQRVTISDFISNSTIHYTTDGTAPTSDSTLYKGPIAVSSTETIKAIAQASGYLPSAVATAIYTIHLATPTLTWETPTAIVYGTLLSAKELDAKASVAGSFIYSPAAGALLDATSQKLSVTFEPTDAIHYNKASASVTLTVRKATPKIVLSCSPGSGKQGATVTCRATLSGRGATPAGAVSFFDGKTRLNTETLSAAGIATYSTDKLAVGKHSITASFGGGENYLAEVSAPDSITVTAN